MKRQLTFAIFALLFTTIFTPNASAQFGGLLNKVNDKIDKVKQEVEAAKKAKKDLEKLANAGANKNTKNQPSANQNNPDSWITISKTHTRVNEAHVMSMNTLGCGDSVFATVNYLEPVDNSGGFTISMLVDGALVAKQQMSGGSATSVNQTIHVELIAAEDADDDYPKVTFAKAGAILKKLQPADHAIQLTVALNDDPQNVAVGEFQYTGGLNCDAKQPRKPNTQKGTTKINNGNQQTTVNTEEQTTAVSQREEPQPEPVKPAEDPEVEIYNSCGDTRYVQIERPSGSGDNLNFHGTREFHRYPLGTKIYVVIDGNKELIDTVVANPSNTSYGRQVISLCK